MRIGRASQQLRVVLRRRNTVVGGKCALPTKCTSSFSVNSIDLLLGESSQVVSGTGQSTAGPTVQSTAGPAQKTVSPLVIVEFGHVAFVSIIRCTRGVQKVRS